MWQSPPPPSGPPVLDGRVALVTGAGRGIGRAIALTLARAGADVAALDVATPEDTARQVQALGRRGLALGADVSDRHQVAGAVATTVRQLGGLHVLVNNAGIVERRRLEDLDEATLHRTLDVNVKGPLLVTQAAWPHLRERGGAVVNIASVSGMVGGAPSRPADPSATASGRSGPAYAASKGAVIALTRWLAREGGARGVRVNAVAPGPVETEMTRGFDYDVGGQPLARMGQAEDIAQAVLYLASPMSAFVTGQVLVVDGGVVLD